VQKNFQVLVSSLPVPDKKTFSDSCAERPRQQKNKKHDMEIFKQFI
jgi:hypothetical protein